MLRVPKRGWTGIFTGGHRLLSCDIRLIFLIMVPPCLTPAPPLPPRPLPLPLPLPLPPPFCPCRQHSTSARLSCIALIIGHCRVKTDNESLLHVRGQSLDLICWLRWEATIEIYLRQKVSSRNKSQYTGSKLETAAVMKVLPKITVACGMLRRKGASRTSTSSPRR